MRVHSVKAVSGYAFFLTAERMRMSKLITYENQTIEVSDRLFEFMEQDKKHQAAEERSDRRHLSKSSFETVKIKQECSSKEFENLVFHKLSLKKMLSALKEHTFSQKRGTLHIAVGRISFIVFWISAGRKLIDKVHPIERHQQVHARSNT